MLIQFIKIAGGGKFAGPHPSTTGISNNLGIIISSIFLLFLLYIILKVRKSLKDDLKNKRPFKK
jgi:hypothetical protein